MNGNKNVIPQLLHPEDIEAGREVRFDLHCQLLSYQDEDRRHQGQEGQQRRDEDQGNSQTMESNFSTSRKSRAAGELGGI